MPTRALPDDVIRIVIIDDHPIIREGLIAVLGREHDLSIVGVGATAVDAIELAEQQLPDILLLDVNMPGGGLTALARITARCPAIAVIILTVKEEADTVTAAMKGGARGYVLKGISGTDLAEVVRTIRRGDPYITPTLAARVLVESAVELENAQRSDEEHVVARLTVREQQILRLVADGASNKQIANELALSESTVKQYMSNLMQKMQVKNRVEAALAAKRQLAAE